MSLTAPEVTRLGSDLQKASAAEPDAVLKILTQLRKDVTASEDLLRTTKIGITVNKFKTHKDPKIARAAGEVVAKWRRDVKSGAAAATGKAGSPGGGESGKSTPVAGTPVKSGGEAGAGAANANGKKEEGGFKANVPLEKRSSVTDKMDTDRTGNQIRDSCLKLMYDGLANMSEERKCNLHKIPNARQHERMRASNLTSRSTTRITQLNLTLYLHSPLNRPTPRDRNRIRRLHCLRPRNLRHLQAKNALALPKPQKQIKPTTAPAHLLRRHQARAVRAHEPGRAQEQGAARRGKRTAEGEYE